MTKDNFINQEQLITRKYSIAMKGNNMRVDDFYSRIKENGEITFEALLKERMGFWKCGQLLNKAKKEFQNSNEKIANDLLPTIAIDKDNTNDLTTFLDRQDELRKINRYDYYKT